MPMLMIPNFFPLFFPIYSSLSTLAQMNHSELSHMAGAVDDSTINIVVVIIIIIITLSLCLPLL